MTRIYSAHCNTGSQDSADRVATALQNMVQPASAVTTREIADSTGRWEVTGYFDSIPEETGLKLIEVALTTDAFIVEAVQEVDWDTESQKSLKPVTAGRFWIHNRFNSGQQPPGSQALCIEPSEAFGTGHHQSTRGCLLAIDWLERQGFTPGRVCDLGCGTALLAMAATRCWPTMVVATDSDPVAIASARNNLVENGAEQVELRVASGFDHPLHLANRPYDLVIANLLLPIILELAVDMTGHVSPGSIVVLSGLLQSQTARVCRRYEDLGFETIDSVELDEWSTLIMQLPA